MDADLLNKLGTPPTLALPRPGEWVEYATAHGDGLSTLRGAGTWVWPALVVGQGVDGDGWDVRPANRDVPVWLHVFALDGSLAVGPVNWNPNQAPGTWRWPQAEKRAHAYLGVDGRPREHPAGGKPFPWDPDVDPLLGRTPPAQAVDTTGWTVGGRLTNPTTGAVARYHGPDPGGQGVILVTPVDSPGDVFGVDAADWRPAVPPIPRWWPGQQLRERGTGRLGVYERAANAALDWVNVNVGGVSTLTNANDWEPVPGTEPQVVQYGGKPPADLVVMDRQRVEELAVAERDLRQLRRQHDHLATFLADNHQADLGDYMASSGEPGTPLAAVYALREQDKRLQDVSAARVRADGDLALARNELVRLRDHLDGDALADLVAQADLGRDWLGERNVVTRAMQLLDACRPADARERERLGRLSHENEQLAAWIMAHHPSAPNAYVSAQGHPGTPMGIVRWLLEGAAPLLVPGALAVPEPGSPPASTPGQPNPEKRQRGLFRKYDVRRVDGEDAPGRPHHGCQLFVLDLSHDPHAKPAALAYATSCAADYPRLAEDLRRAVWSGPPDLGQPNVVADLGDVPEQERRQRVQDNLEGGPDHA